MSIVSNAFALRRACREEYESWRAAMFDQAEEECRGRLLNRLGFSRGIDAYSLFMGSADRANLYASDELLEFWRVNPRRNYRQYEDAWMRGRLRDEETPI
jgi:hypothetical protein